MREQLLHKLQVATRSVLTRFGDTEEIPHFMLEVSRQAEHGDFACNAAMLLAKRLKKNPREIAQALIDALGSADGLVARAEIAGPGFVNLWLSSARWQTLLRSILQAGETYGASKIGAGKKLQVEFVSANPTGPLTLGHGRQAILGDSLARLLDFCGYDVTREYYFNNGGRQMRVLGHSVKARYLELLGKAAPPPPEWFQDPEKLWQPTHNGLPVVFPSDGYQGEYIVQIARKVLDEHGEAWISEPEDQGFRLVAQEVIFAEIRETLDRLGIRFDVYYNETTLYEEGKLEQTLAALRAQNLAYEADGAVWIRATKLGLDRDRVLVKRTGEPTYLLPDIAYHCEKFRRGFDYVIDVQGADHIEQFPFVRAAAAALGCDPQRIELVMHQFVTLTRDGEQVKQSTRRATFVTVDELVEDVGVDVFRFFMVQRKAEGHLDFDLDLAKSPEWSKNPAIYLQYAYARTHGIERKAAENQRAMPRLDEIDAGRLELPEEIELLKKLAEFPDVVWQAAQPREPHHLAYYLRQLAGLWHPYHQDGKHHRILSEDVGLTNARIGLALAVRTVLANGLRLLGVSAPERM